VKAIAHARIKTDKIDAGVLASLQAAGFLPEVWLPDAETERRRRLVARRNQIVRHRTRVKNETHAILAAHLIPPCPHAELFNRPGRDWLARQVLPDDERAAIARHLRELDRLGEDLAALDRDIGVAVVDDPAGAASAHGRRHEHHGRCGAGRCDRRHPSLLEPAEAGQLLRP
jgi:transposase